MCQDDNSKDELIKLDRKDQQASDKELKIKKILSQLKEILGAQKYEELIPSGIKTIDFSTWRSVVFHDPEERRSPQENDGELFCLELDGIGRQIVVLHHKENVPFAIMAGGIDRRPWETWVYSKDPGEPTTCERLAQPSEKHIVPHEQAPNLTGLITSFKKPEILGFQHSSETFSDLDNLDL